MSPPKISVIMAVHNEENYVLSSIESVLVQSFDNFEFIIIDDASTDNTRQLLEEINDDRFIFIKNDKNLGLTSSLNLGIKAASGDYIARIDADDLWHSEHLKNIESMFDDKDIVLVGASHREFLENDSLSWENVQFVAGDFREITTNDLLKRNLLCHSAVVFKREISGNLVLYREEFLRSQDYELWLRLSMLGKIIKLPCETCHYCRRISALSLTSTEEQLRFAVLARLSIADKLDGGTDFTIPHLGAKDRMFIREESLDILIHFANKLFIAGKYFLAIRLFLRAGFFFPINIIKNACDVLVSEK